MPVIVVTGSNGFIGTNILQEVLKLELEDVGLTKPKLSKFVTAPRTEDDRLARVVAAIAADTPESTTRALHARFAGSSRLEFVLHTQLEATLKNLKEKPLAIVHNGACSSTVETDPDVFEKLNLGYTKMIWNLCADLGIPMIYASSAAVYGDGSQGFSDRKEDNSKFRPLNLYGKSKHDFDCWALEQAKTPPTWFGLRYFNVYGPHENHKGGQASMVFHGYNQATRTGKIRLFQSTTPEYSDGNQLRDFVFVRDIIDVTMDLLRICWERERNPGSHPIPGNGMFLNIGTGTARSWNDLATALFDALGLPPHIEYIPMPEQIARHYQNYTCADLTSLRALGITRPMTSLEDGVKTYVQRFLMRGL